MKPPFYKLKFPALIFYRRESVANDAGPREASVANAADLAIDSTDDNWIKLSPYGVFPGSRPGRPQHFGEEEANAVVANFSGIKGKVSRLFKEVSIFIGHPDVNPEVYTDHRRLGKIVDLEARADGLYGEVQWNALGMENKREGFWRFPSTRWDAPFGRPEFRPDRLISVGLTNWPRISESEPATNSTDFPNTNIETEMDRKLITDKLGLAVTATDEEILAKITNLMSADADAATKVQEATAMKTERDTVANDLTVARSKIFKLEAQVQTEREAYANSLLDQAEAQGRVTKAERPAWLPRLTGDARESEANALLELTPKLNTKSLDVSHSRIQIGNAAERRETIANAVDAYMAKGMTYDEAYTSAEKDPALKPVWDAMNHPQEA